MRLSRLNETFRENNEDKMQKLRGSSGWETFFLKD